MKKKLDVTVNTPHKPVDDFVGKTKDTPDCYVPGAYSPVATKRTCPAKWKNGIINFDCTHCRVWKNTMGIDG